MNDFSSIQNSGLLKDNYEPEKTGQSALEKALQKKRKQYADTRLGIKDEFARAAEEKDKLGF